MKSAEDRLGEFQTQNNIATKGPLSLVIQFTRLVRDKEFPLNSDDFQTSSKGQVAGLGGGKFKENLERTWDYTTVVCRGRKNKQRQHGSYDKIC